MKTVLVTRPEQQGKALCESLRAKQYRALHVPVLATEALVDAEARRRIANCFERLASFDAIIVVSVNAAEQACAHWQHHQLPVQHKVFAVGKSTADYLQRMELWRNRSPVIYPLLNMDSEGLLALPELSVSQVAGKRFLILRGEGGRELIAQTLAARGAQVESCELYRRVIPHGGAEDLRAALAQADVVLINSVESLQNFLVLAGAACTFDKILVVPGARVAEAARTAGFRHIIVAANATDAAILDALRDHFAQ